MKRDLTNISIGLAVIAVCLNSALAQNNLREAVGKPAQDATATVNSAEPARDPLTIRLESLTPQDRIAQLMLVTLEGGMRPDPTETSLLSRYVPGGVLLPSITNPGWTADYVNSLRNSPAETAKGIPMLIGTNLYDLPRPRGVKKAFFVPVPSLMAIAAAADPDVTLRVANHITQQLSTLGINMHLGPSLELAPTLEEAKGSIHCLGSDPNFVAESGAVIMGAMDAAGIISVPTGFPGGGMNRLPESPPVLLTPRTQWAERDLLPYAKAIESGVRMIHVGTTLVRQDDGRTQPSCVSEFVMRNMLRQQLKFEGVIVAGPFDTNDIAVSFDLSEAAILALQSGADMLYWNEAGNRVMKTVDDIHKAIEDGRLSQDVIDAALTRVLKLKDEAKLAERPRPSYADAEKSARKKSQINEAYEIERRSITLAQNRGGVLPLNKKSSVPVAITGVFGVEALHGPLEEYLKPVLRQEIRTAEHGGRIYDFEVDRLTRRAGGIKTVVVICSPSIELNGQVQLVDKFKALGMQTIVVLVGYPGALPKFAAADAVLLTYSEADSITQSMKAVADILVGQAPISILPFVDDLRTNVGKMDQYNVLDIIRAPAGRLPVTLASPYHAGLAIPYDPTFTIKKAVWEFGDGEVIKKMIADKAFKEPGRYPITLTVTDGKGWETKSTFYATVD